MNRGKAFSTSGFKELDAVLGDLPKATAANVLRRVGLRVLQPIAEEYGQSVDVVTGVLQDNIGVGTKLTRRQARGARKDGKDFVEVYAGAGNVPHAHLEEFGSIHNAPNGALRRAWENGRDDLIPALGRELAPEVAKAVERHARKVASAAAKLKG